MHRSTYIVLFALSAPALPLQAQLCFRAKSLPECRWLVITEFGVHAKILDTSPGKHGYLTGEVGGMINVARRAAVGATLQYGVDRASRYRIAVKPRFRYWATNVTSIDVSVGTLVDGSNFLEFPGFSAHVALNYRNIIGVSIMFEAYEDQSAGDVVDWWVGGRLGQEWGISAGLLAVLIVLAAALGLSGAA